MNLADLIDPRSLDAATVIWHIAYRDGRGGGCDRCFAHSRELLDAAIARRIDRIDPYRSPSISSAPRVAPDGRWTAEIQWWGLGD